MYIGNIQRVKHNVLSSCIKYNKLVNYQKNFKRIIVKLTYKSTKIKQNKQLKVYIVQINKNKKKGKNYKDIKLNRN